MTTVTVTIKDRSKSIIRTEILVVPVSHEAKPLEFADSAVFANLEFPSSGKFYIDRKVDT